jgi:FlaA1/EpsC-like NDP-sugar epimerase
MNEGKLRFLTPSGLGAGTTISSLRQVLLLALDGAIPAIGLWLAMLLRFERGVIPPEYVAALPRLVVLLVCCRIVANVLLKLHRWSFRFSGLPDAARVALAGLFGTGLFMSGVYLARIQGPPRSVVVMELFFSTAAMGFVRFSPRLAWTYLADRTRSQKNGVVRTLIVGAGAAGETLLRDLQRSDQHNYRVVGFVDDDRSKLGMIVGGKPVLGGISDLRSIVQRHEIGKVLIAIPRLSSRRIREILSLCTDLKVRFKILPVSFIYLRERLSASMLQDLSPDDLLPRPQVSFHDGDQVALVRGRRTLVTGAAGSIGSEICLQLARAGIGSLVMVDVNENGLYLLKRRLEREASATPVFAEVGDIRDPKRMSDLVKRYAPQDIFHAAAHKHVPLLEGAPCEAVKNNILATRELAAIADARGVERFVYISTDKAVRPTSVMGASKRVGEMVVRAMARQSQTRFCAVRFGNVLGSAGSVVPLFREQIAAGGPVTVTDQEVRRYFMTISEAVGLVLTAAYSDSGELCVLDMGEQIRIVELARAMITMAGQVPDVDIPIVFTGLRPGEKLYEELMTEEEERTQRVADKIFVAECPAPPVDLGQRLQELELAACGEDAQRVRDLLRDLVPSYQTPAAIVAPTEQKREEEGELPLM